MRPRTVRIDGFAVPAHGPDDGDAATIRQLLARTSGADLEFS
jgi:hypothetical protein